MGVAIKCIMWLLQSCMSVGDFRLGVSCTLQLLMILSCQFNTYHVNLPCELSIYQLEGKNFVSGGNFYTCYDNARVTAMLSVVLNFSTRHFSFLV